MERRRGLNYVSTGCSCFHHTPEPRCQATPCTPWARLIGGLGCRKRTLWCGEVDDVSVRLEHVDLLDGLDWLDVHLLENGLELLLINTRVLWLGLDLASWGSLSAICPYLSALHPNHAQIPDSANHHFCSHCNRHKRSHCAI